MTERDKKDPKIVHEEIEIDLAPLKLLKKETAQIPIAQLKLAKKKKIKV